jgi:hypothetical protein
MQDHRIKWAHGQERELEKVLSGEAGQFVSDEP